MSCKRRVLVAAVAFAILLLGAGSLVVVCRYSTFLAPRPGPKPPLADRVSDGANRMGIELLDKMHAHDPDANVIISPLSIGMALAMAANGAKGGTRKEMDQVLGVADLSPESINNANRWMRLSLLQPNRDMQISVANSIWADRGVKFNPMFIQTDGQSYDAYVDTTDLNGPAGPKRINDWVNHATRGQIPQMVDAFPADTRAVLVNATYFKAKWANPFDKNVTEPHDFFLQNGDRISVPMMNQEGQFGYLETPQFQAVRLPYRSGETSFYAFLPRKGTTLAELNKSLTSENLMHWTCAFSEANVTVRVPRFRVECIASLKKPLLQMGMDRALNPNQADFSNMTLEPVWISDVIHKVAVELNEDGSTVATAASEECPTPGLPPKGMNEICLDHPFLFAIIDSRIGSLLFVGMVNNPIGK